MIPTQRFGAVVQVAAIWLFIAVANCTPEAREVPATQLIVHVVSTASVQSALHRLRLRTAFPDGERWSQRAESTYEREALKWPVDLVLVTKDEAKANIHFEVIVEGLDDSGSVLVQSRVLTSFVRRQGRVLTVELAPCGRRILGELCESASDCHGPSCQTCVDGQCGPTPLMLGDDLPHTSGEPAGSIDAMNEAGVDVSSITSDSGNAEDRGLDAGPRAPDAGTFGIDAIAAPSDAVSDASLAIDVAHDSQSTIEPTVCPSGYDAGSDGGCSDFDECTLPNNGGCPVHSTCNNRPGRRDCVCDPGYADINGDGSLCKSLCENACDPIATCALVNATPVCSCPSAYTTTNNGKTCTFDASCSLLTCDANATCVVSGATTRVCECRTGYRGTGTTCTNIVECTETPTICGANTVCSDTQGGYTCACQPDYQNKGSGCQKIDDCANNACGTGATGCTDGINTRVCTCGTGYDGTGTTQCTDRNECQTNNGGCDPHVTCSNFNGGRTCGPCPAGYTGTGASGCLEFWPVQLGTAARDFASSVVTDGASVYVVGGTEGSLGAEAQGRSDAYIAKYNSAGQRQWLQQIGSSQDDYFGDIAFDPNGNLFVSGSTIGSLEANYNGSGGDGIVAKYNPSGQLLWLHQFGTGGTEEVHGIAADRGGNLFVVGETWGALDGHTPLGSGDGFLIKYNSAGTRQWSQFVDGANHEAVAVVTTDANGDIFVVATTDASFDSTPRQGDTMLVKYDTAGKRQWSKQLGSIGFPQSAAIDAGGNIYVSGNAIGALDGQSPIGEADLYVTKLNSSGVTLWSRLLGSSGADDWGQVALTADGSVYLAGQVNGTVDDHPPLGAEDLVVAKYNSAGEKQWSRQFGTADQEFGPGIAADATGVYIVSSTGSALPGQTNLGGRDAFVVKYDNAGTMF